MKPSLSSIDKQGTAELKYKLRLPEPDGTHQVPAGSRMFLRSEIQQDGETCSFSVPTTVRVGR
mgnify:CR=1 FL=1